jgi:hypothetical protein
MGILNQYQQGLIDLDKGRYTSWFGRRYDTNAALILCVKPSGNAEKSLTIQRKQAVYIYQA